MDGILGWVVDLRFVFFKPVVLGDVDIENINRIAKTSWPIQTRQVLVVRDATFGQEPGYRLVVKGRETLGSEDKLIHPPFFLGGGLIPLASLRCSQKRPLTFWVDRRV